jgi:hypothetical protein
MNTRQIRPAMTDLNLLHSNILTPGQLQQHAWNIIEPFGHIASLHPFFAKIGDLPKAVEEELTLAMKIVVKLTVDLAHADDSGESGDIAEPTATNMDMPAPILVFGQGKCYRGRGAANNLMMVCNHFAQENFKELSQFSD